MATQDLNSYTSISVSIRKSPVAGLMTLPYMNSWHNLKKHVFIACGLRRKIRSDSEIESIMPQLFSAAMFWTEFDIYQTLCSWFNVARVQSWCSKALGFLSPLVSDKNRTVRGPPNIPTLLTKIPSEIKEQLNPFSGLQKKKTTSNIGRHTASSLAQPTHCSNHQQPTDETKQKVSLRP